MSTDRMAPGGVPQMPMFEVAGRVLLGRYRVGREVGRGGFGAVYDGVDLRSDKKVAIKFLLPSGGISDAAGLARFHREANITASLNHPYVVAILDTGEIDSLPFIV